MYKKIILLGILFFMLPFFHCMAQDEGPDTVSTGIYITSIHDIDFRQREYTVNFWLWFNYKNPDFDFAKYLEIPQAKSMNTLYSAVDTMEDGSLYVLLKLQCVMKDSWKIDDFPFNHQSLRLSIENSQYDKSMLVFAKDTVGEIYDRHALTGYGIDSTRGWHIDPDSVKISIGTKAYETNFGDASLGAPHMMYSAFKVKIGINRDAWALFWKIFLGMYIAFLIAFVSSFIHLDHIEARFGLTVGALFAVVGNKYIIESSLPESSLFTLVDWLHGLTLLFIFSIIVSTTIALWMKKKSDFEIAKRIDTNVSLILFIAFVISNVLLIYGAL
ncbi:MAG: hypothetical protein ABI763_11610 [Bacteroidota bacterium]